MTNPTSTSGPVVVGVSESPESDRAVDWAADHAATARRRLVVVHAAALERVDRDIAQVLRDEQTVAEAAEAVADKAARRAADRHPDLDVVTSVAVGDPPVALLDYSDDASLLVVGSRRGESRHLPMGSVSLAVARHARCPVVVVRGDGVPDEMADRVVLGVDGTPGSRAAAEFAFWYASLHGLGLAIVHGSWERFARGSAVLALLSRGEEHGPTPEEELTVAETIAGLPEVYPDVRHHAVHRSADPATALVETSASARLVVVGSRRLGALASIAMRSVSTSLVEHALCPVAVVPGPPATSQ